MQTMDQALQDLVKGGMITTEEAMLRATKPDDFRRMRM
jgi:Tfp pilus assembly pilus retraction ATPase PilT